MGRRRLGIGITLACLAPAAAGQGIGEELALPVRLGDGEEFTLSIEELLAQGRAVFTAGWTAQEGQGRLLTKGTGGPLSDPGAPLAFPRNMNRVSAPDSNSCAGCHDMPRAGGAGDFSTNVFVLGQRFDFATFHGLDLVPTKGNVDETGAEVTLQTIGNSRQTVGMFGGGFLEMLARQITEDLQATRDGCAPGASVALRSKGLSFGALSRDAAGAWDTRGVEGLPPPSLATSGPGDPPSLLVLPFHQAGAAVSLRQFTNSAMNHHHGIQTVERFGAGADPDGDGFSDELSIADVTAVTVFQAALDVPGRVIPDDPERRAAVLAGELSFVEIGCSSCHVPGLPLDEGGWVYTEPNPFNPPGNLRPGDRYVTEHGTLAVDLTDKRLPGPRPKPRHGVWKVWAFTDFKLHDITSGAPGDPNVEPIDMHAPAGSRAFFAGNSRFLSSRLWGAASQMPYYHHGLYTTMREAIEAHAGEAAGVMRRWRALSASQRDEVIEFLKTLRILEPGTKHLVVDEGGHPVHWPAFPWAPGQDVPPLP